MTCRDWLTWSSRAIAFNLITSVAFGLATGSPPETPDAVLGIAQGLFAGVLLGRAERRADARRSASAGRLRRPSIN